MATNYWCHVCYTTVPASEAKTHVHKKDAPAYSDPKSKWFKGKK